MSSWRSAGISYVGYSAVAARCVRRCLKPNDKVDAVNAAKDLMKIRAYKWENGKAPEQPELLTRGNLA
ncbi:hypothetical protein SARC_01079 [Sphaeroforma arctica JP610]|uniref:ATP synthase subunit epsilon, mitochondrial n=1 Tax=Sphaeroforma arctica JP610 TaxID=667725 RepID=A0A0L0GD20_9EUKA|nr:hypothetical protein SARC_01079 [Sphaeroforma arctica JP610]KNC86786.1 hypothetical protein SARC_01079 [Sphaeroforma arctica JP610]|eukprot:XP_014160688.1 hypothetical protein SARC_01079 [Sphaeroforma arctica JP610]